MILNSIHAKRFDRMYFCITLNLLLSIIYIKIKTAIIDVSIQLIIRSNNVELFY